MVTFNPLKKTYGTRFLLFSTILFSLLYLVPPSLPTDKNGLVDGSKAPDFGVGASPEENEESIFKIRCEAWIALDARLKEIIKRITFS